MRALYQLILWLHPPAFRSRFRAEMLSIFEEGGARQSSFALLFDGLISLGRQWLLRTSFWKVLTAIGIAFVQVWGLGWRTTGHQSWTVNHQALTPDMQQIILITLALICSLLVMIMSLAIWTLRFQRRRSEGRALHLAGIAGARLHARH